MYLDNKFVTGGFVLEKKYRNNDYLICFRFRGPVVSFFKKQFQPHADDESIIWKFKK